MTGQRRVDPSAVRCLIDRIKQAKVSGHKTGISEAGQRRKQYQAEVGVTGTGSEFQGRAVRGQTQRVTNSRMNNAQKCQPGQEQDFAVSACKSAA